MSEARYDVPTSCNRCGGRNDIVSQDGDMGPMYSCDTVCLDCDHKDEWDTGFFRSGTEGMNSCVKYGFKDNGQYFEVQRATPPQSDKEGEE